MGSVGISASGNLGRMSEARVQMAFLLERVSVRHR